MFHPGVNLIESMLNRRHLRVKVLQSLYAYFQSHNQDLARGEREMMHGVEKIFDMYLYQLMFLKEIAGQEEAIIEENKVKHLPSSEDLNPNTRILENRCLAMISGHSGLQKLAAERGINWQGEREIVRKLLQMVKQQSYYREYSGSEDTSLEADTAFVTRMIKKNILSFEPLHAFYEEKSIYWIDDWELVNKMLIRTIKNAQESGENLRLMELFKDPTDKEFAVELFRRAILNREEFGRIISAKTKNWDVERIALMDMIIMEMALTEILKFPQIPVKVSLNEYIELSKMYSTPKSKVFVNGILDKLVDEFVREKKINKHASGLDNEASE